MEIREIRERENKLMNAIQKLVREFEFETTVRVRELSVRHSYDIDKEITVALIGVESTV